MYGSRSTCIMGPTMRDCSLVFQRGGIRKIENQKSCAAMARLLLQADTLRRVASTAPLFFGPALSPSSSSSSVCSIYSPTWRGRVSLYLSVCAHYYCVHSSVSWRASDLLNSRAPYRKTGGDRCNINVQQPLNDPHKNEMKQDLLLLLLLQEPSQRLPSSFSLANSLLFSLSSSVLHILLHPAVHPDPRNHPL